MTLSLSSPLPFPCLEQAFLIERDTGLLCRLLGLYAARALDVLHVELSCTAQDAMSLRVRIGPGALTPGEALETVRVLLARASTLVGVIEASGEPASAPPHRMSSRSFRARVDS